MDEIEVFREIEGRPGYWVSNMGRVQSRKRKDWNFLSIHVNRLGFPEVQVFQNCKATFISIAREVLAAFRGYPAEPWLCVAKHINGDLLDCRLSNLEWVVCETDENYDPSVSHRRGVLKPEHTKAKMTQSKFHQSRDAVEKAVMTRQRSIEYRKMFKKVNDVTMSDSKIEEMKDIYSIHNRLKNGK